MSKKKKSVKKLHDYWVENSSPESYLVPQERSKFLLEYVKKYMQPNAKIIELGCNVGRNLHELYQNDYKNLTGIEISKQAVEKMGTTFPDMANEIEVVHTPIEDWIKQVNTYQYDLVFTMAVLEHIHPDSEWVFEHIARISREYILTIEDENSTNWRLFPRNYKEIFEKYDFEQIEEADCKKANLEKYRLRIFKRTIRAFP
ncbi:methyltransferase domain-containing protein [Gracilibacillus oryzae]|uniref:Methyltransferase domain-containing protein n=1 Tax=Gracilibacillus oryzae TaxID=1672701 RepID=A0A7C8GT94_9BACI|nr:class I SAM-dependent methyltransferase [Gracilibacillus oryzae]KAB8135802.1 methyltransferase domain-containing protein [Gracilibacillus oryzae]